MADPLDAERIEALRTWGTSLAKDSDEAFRAAGRAILILIDEVERLRPLARQAPDGEEQTFVRGRNGVPLQEPVEVVSSQSLGTSLRERLGVGI
jgi:hypothetical protein